MSVKKQITEKEGVYFITFTCYQGLPLFELTSSYDAVYKCPSDRAIRVEFDHLKTKGHHIIGYVIMPNHVHALIAFRKSSIPVNIQVGNGK